MTRVEMALIAVGVIAWITLAAACMGAFGAVT